MGRLGDVGFADGVCASLKWLSQSLTYAGLLDGAPTDEMNRDLVSSARERYRHAWSWAGPARPVGHPASPSPTSLEAARTPSLSGCTRLLTKRHRGVEHAVGSPSARQRQLSSYIRLVPGVPLLSMWPFMSRTKMTPPAVWSARSRQGSGMADRERHRGPAVH